MPVLSNCWRLLVLLAGLYSGAVWSQVAAEPALSVTDGARKWLDAQLANSATPVSGLRTEVVVGELDSRLRLAPCAKVETFLPAGSRLWGKTRVGLRCTEGAVRWSVYLPLTVKVFGKAWVTAGNLSAGAVLTDADVVEAEVDWADDASPVVADRSWLGQTTTRPLVSGQVIRASLLRPPQVFQAGTTVRVVAQGNGFSVTSEGQAMTPGVVGQPVRVRMDGGRVMSGHVLDAKTVRLEM